MLLGVEFYILGEQPSQLGIRSISVIVRASWFAMGRILSGSTGYVDNLMKQIQTDMSIPSSSAKIS